MITNIYSKTTFFLLFFIYGFYCISCNSEGSTNNQIERLEESNQMENSLSGNNQTQYAGINENSNSISQEIWEIPSLKNSKESETSFIKVESDEGIEMEVMIVEHILEPYQIIENPNKKLGKIAVQKVRIFSFNSKQFSFKLNAQLASFNKEKKEWEGQGPIFFYTFYDNDGDGTFETNSLDRNENFFTKPKIPKWIQTRDF